MGKVYILGLMLIKKRVFDQITVVVIEVTIPNFCSVDKERSEIKVNLSSEKRNLRY